MSTLGAYRGTGVVQRVAGRKDWNGQAEMVSQIQLLLLDSQLQMAVSLSSDREVAGYLSLSHLDPMHYIHHHLDSYWPLNVVMY